MRKTRMSLRLPASGERRRTRRRSNPEVDSGIASLTSTFARNDRNFVFFACHPRSSQPLAGFRMALASLLVFWHDNNFQSALVIAGCLHDAGDNGSAVKRE